jgi:hypothetical protein
MHKSTIIKLILLTLAILVQGDLLFAQSKKSKGNKVSIIRKGFDDITTRNNYYYNANYIYTQMVKSFVQSRSISAGDSLPFYFHDYADFTGNTSQLDEVKKKLGIVLQLHDYSRWKDDAYLLLGKAYFLKQNYDSALYNFQYIASNLKGKTSSTKAEISSKEILKLKKQRQKELDKAVKNKKEAIANNQKDKEKEIQDLAEEKKEQMEKTAKQKQKELQAKIKAKEKMLKQKKKGKYDASKQKKPTTQPKPVVQQPKPASTPKPPVKSTSQKTDAAIKKLEEAKKKQELAEIDAINKKDAARDKLSFWQKIKHKPSRSEAVVWAVKAAIAQRDFETALTYLDYAKSMRKLTKKQKLGIALVDAYYHIKFGSTALGAEKLQKAIPLIKSKKDKAYYTYYLANLYLRNTSDTSARDALATYQKVLKLTKDEDIVFNTQLQIAEIYANNTLDGDVQHKLERIVKKGKNKENLGQALLALGNIYMSQSDTSAAIKSYGKAATDKNSDLAATAFLKLGDVYYAKKLYHSATSAYDSARMKASTSHSHYDEIITKSTAFHSIDSNLNLVREQDSVMTLAKMSKADLEIYLEKIRKQEEKELRQKNAKVESYNGNQSPIVYNPTLYTSNGLWYFYNPETKAIGYNKFKAQWGERPYKYFWNVAAKSQGLLDGNTDYGTTNTDDVAVSTTIADTLKRKTLNIPETIAEKAISDSITKAALYQLGYDFYARLRDNETANYYLKMIEKRYGINDPQVAYLCYLVAKSLGREQEASIYKGIIDAYPQHPAQLAIKNIDKESQKSAEELYRSAYLSYQAGDYAGVIAARNNFRNIYANTPWSAQIEYLYAMSLAHTSDRNAYKDALVSLIDNFPDSEVKEHAEFQLKTLENIDKPLSQQIEISPNTTQEVLVTEAMAEGVTKELYKDNGGQFFVMFVIKNKNPNPDEISNKLNDFIAEKYLGNTIKAATAFLDEKTQLVLIKRFVNSSLALDFFNTYNASKNNILGADNVPLIEVMIISQDNFKTLFSTKDLDTYRKFHKEKYKL